LGHGIGVMWSDRTIAWWRLDEGFGGLVHDLGEHDFTGQLVGGYEWIERPARHTLISSAQGNPSAESVGRNARIAEELHYENTGGANGGYYTDDLDDLLAFDRNLTDDPNVTFLFGEANCSGYTFNTSHVNGNITFHMTD